MFNKFVLDNGVRIVCEEMLGVRSVAIGFWIKTGSRFENSSQAGVSHLIEHLLFKGTKKRTAKQIAEAIEAVGGQLNAFTSKEYTCFYARVLDEHLSLALDILSDMVFSSLFLLEDIEREKSVVQEEIRMYEDTPDEIIHDLFAQTIWNDHPLGRPIIGTIDSVGGLTKEEILSYYQKHYNPSNLVVSLAGNLKKDTVLSVIKPFLKAVVNNTGHNFEGNNYQQNSPQAKAVIKNINRPLEQVHFCLGVPALCHFDERIYTLQILNNVLGGGASSRLFQKIREDRALVYSIYSYYTAFSDAGLFTIYAGTNPKNFQEVIDLIWNEIQQVIKSGITLEELDRAKEQIKGSLLMAQENVIHRMQRIGKSELIHQRLITLDEILQKISKVTLEDIHDLAREMLGLFEYTLAVIGQIDIDKINFPWSSYTSTTI